MGGFQKYLIVDGGMACHIPDVMSFAEASIFPFCVAAPVHGLFSKDFLALPNPKFETISTGKSVLVWEGSSAAGSNTVQLAKAAGFEAFSNSSQQGV